MIVIRIILYLWESAEWTLKGLQSLIDCFLACELVELGKGRGSSINVVQSIPIVFVVIYYLSSAMYIKAFSYSTWFCPVTVISLQAYNCSCNINIHDVAKMFGRRSQNTLAHLYTPGVAYLQITKALSQACECKHIS